MKTECDRCGEPHPKCDAHNRAGRPCMVGPGPGASVCWRHGGRARQVQQAAAVRSFAEVFQLSGPAVDIRQTMLDLVGQSRRRAELYAELLRQAWAGGDGFPDALASDPGVAALIGHRYGLTKDGTALPIEEAVRGLVQLENAERDRCMRFCRDAAAAGVSERLLAMAEQHADLVVRVITAAATRAGLEPAQRVALLTAAVAELDAEDQTQSARGA